MVTDRKDHIIYFDGSPTWRTWNDYSLRNKWNSFCMSVDFQLDNAELYINGQVIILTTLNKLPVQSLC